MSIDVVEKILTNKRNIQSKSLYKLIKEINNSVYDHRIMCNPCKVDLINNTIFCKKCGKILLKFCLSCGSTMIESKDYFDICYSCGKLYENHFY